MRRYNLNHELFATFTPDNCYMAGFLLADGSVSGKGNTINININERDINLLYHWGQLINKPSDAIGERFVKLSDGTTSRMVQMSATSAKMKDDLVKFGVIPNKTYNHVPPQIPDDMFLPFLIGFIDGDGCFPKRRSPSGVRISSVCLTGNLELLDWFKLKILDLYGISSGEMVIRNPWGHLLYFGEERDRLLQLCFNGYDGFKFARKWDLAAAHLENRSRGVYYDDMKEFIIKAYESGASMREIIERSPFKQPIGPKGIATTLKAAGVDIRGWGKEGSAPPKKLKNYLEEHSGKLDEIRTLYLGGMGSKGIGKKLSLNHKVVNRILDDLKIDRRSDSKSANIARDLFRFRHVFENKEKMIADYAAGMSLKEVMEKYDVGRRHITMFLREAGIEKRGRWDKVAA